MPEMEEFGVTVGGDTCPCCQTYFGQDDGLCGWCKAPGHQPEACGNNIRVMRALERGRRESAAEIEMLNARVQSLLNAVEEAAMFFWEPRSGGTWYCRHCSWEMPDGDEHPPEVRCPHAILRKAR